MNVTRSVVYGVVGLCKTESSQKPVPLHPLLAETLAQWRERSANRKSEDWVFPSLTFRVNCSKRLVCILPLPADS